VDIEKTHKSRCVNNPQAHRALDGQIWVQCTTAPRSAPRRAHRNRSADVVDRCCVVSDELYDLCIGLRVRERAVLRAEKAIPRGDGHKLPRALDGIDHDGDVNRLAEEGGIDDRGVTRVRRREGDGTA
jgi:hypothetical protein